MSDPEETSMGSGFSTPVPELDDHTHRSPVLQRNSVRRGTLEDTTGLGKSTANPAELGDTDLYNTVARDFEEAISDGESLAGEKARIKSRRGTVTTLDPRSASPPNSIKAFADARRQRAISSSDTDAGAHDDAELHRTASCASRRSRISRRFANDDTRSLAGSAHTAQEDVCYPMYKDTKDVLVVDYGILEDFMTEDVLEHQRGQRRAEGENLRQKAQADDNIAGVTGELLETSSTWGSEKGDKLEMIGEHQGASFSGENRFEYFDSLQDATIHAPNLGGLVLPGESVNKMFPTQTQHEYDGVWWLNIMNPTPEEVRVLCMAFEIHPLTMEDITQREAREKIELFQAYYFASFRSFTIVEEDDGPEYEPYNMYVVVFREGTVSFCYTPNSHANYVRQRITKLNNLRLLSSDWICYALIDHIVDAFAPVIDKVETETDTIDDEVFIARTDDMNQFLRKIGTVRRNVMGLMKLLGGKADVLRGFTKRCNADWKVTPRMDIGLYLGDVQDHVVTMMNNLGQFEKMLSRSHGNYLAQLTIDNIQQGTQANKVLSRVTVLAAFLVPLNLVTGLFGMNVEVPWMNSKTDSLAPFFAILGGLVLFVAVCLACARRFKWL